MSEPDRVPPRADMLGFVTEQIAFVGLGDDDMGLIRRTVPLVLAHEAALTSALYDHLLAFPTTAHFFQREYGSPDLERIERRKETRLISRDNAGLWVPLPISIRTLDALAENMPTFGKGQRQRARHAKERREFHLALGIPQGPPRASAS